MATEVLMPRQGQSVESCIIIEWKVNEGDVVSEGQALCEVETDKATFEVEATAAGTVLGIFYPADSDVEVLKTICVIGDAGEDISALRPADESAEMKPETGNLKPEEKVVARDEPVSSFTSQVSSFNGAASPRAKNLAEKKGLDISTLSGTGPNGRVIERDVLAAPAITPAAAAKASSEGLPIPESGTGMGGRIVPADLVAVAPEAVGEVVASMEFPGAVNEIPVKGCSQGGGEPHA